MRTTKPATSCTEGLIRSYCFGVKPRLADVADRAGVSVATVSRVLNDRPGVNAQTKRAVLTALDVLGYDRPSRLRVRAAGLVGLIVPELENPFFPRFAQRIENVLAAVDYTPVLCTQSLGGIHEDDYVQTLLEHGVSGLIVVSGVHANTDAGTERYERLHELGLPVVLVNGYVPGVPAAFVGTDDAATMDLAVGHLAHMGHRRIGVALGQRRYVPVQRKIAGFAAAMRAHVDAGLSDAAIDALVASTAYTVEGGAMAALDLVEQGVTGITCASDIMALGAIRALRQRGLRVPEDVSVVGCDDSLLIEFTDPPLTTVRQPVVALAETAVKLLLDQIAGAPAPAREVVLRPELVVRGSTARATARAGA